MNDAPLVSPGGQMAARRRLRRRLILAACATAALWLPGGALAGALAEEKAVETKDNVFDPVEITIRAGDSVSFKNTGQLPHTATADDGSWDTGNLNAGQSKSIKFEKEGTFSYNCVYHKLQGMVGTLVVVAQDADIPDPPVGGTSPEPSPAPDQAADPEAAAVQEKQPTEKYFLPLAGLLTLGVLGAMALGYLRTRKKIASLP